MKYKLAFPSTPKVPRISEILLPVTLARILSMPTGLAKYTPLPVAILNSRKL